MAAARLIVNADDLGLARSVNRGIIETMRDGVVTSASLMVNMPAAEDAAVRLADARRDPALDVGVGLHFNIVAGAPLTRAASLLRGKTFAPLHVLLWRALRGTLRLDEVSAELEAQLARAQELLGGNTVTHIDSHRHAHCLPGVFDVVVAAARRHRIPHVRHPVERIATTLGNPRAVLGVATMRALRVDGPALDAVGFAGFALMGSRHVERDLLRLLDRAGRGVLEVMVHPGYDSDELAEIDPYRAPRERELRALTSSRVRSAIRERGMVLTHFGATAPPVSAPRQAVPAAS